MKPVSKRSKNIINRCYDHHFYLSYKTVPCFAARRCQVDKAKETKIVAKNFHFSRGNLSYLSAVTNYVTWGSDRCKDDSN